MDWFPAPPVATTVSVLRPSASATKLLKVPFDKVAGAPFTATETPLASLAVPVTTTLVLPITAPSVGAVTESWGGVVSPPVATQEAKRKSFDSPMPPPVKLDATSEPPIQPLCRLTAA